MLILIDLDGTLINTVHPTWKPYKDGQEDCIIDNYLAQLPVFNGAREFLSSRKAKGDNIVVQFNQKIPLAPGRYTISFGCTKYNFTGDFRFC